MAFMTYEKTCFQTLQDQPTLRAVFNLARQMHEDLALKSDEREEDLRIRPPGTTSRLSAPGTPCIRPSTGCCRQARA